MYKKSNISGSVSYYSYIYLEVNTILAALYFREIYLEKAIS